jgi:hypothetical protein
LSSSTGATVTLKDVSSVPELEFSSGTFLYFDPAPGQDPNFGGLQIGLSGPTDPDGNTASSVLSINSDFIIGVLESPSSYHGWVFDKSANLILPQGGTIKNYDGTLFNPRGVGYTGSASNVRGYAGSAGQGYTGSSGSLGYTGSFGAGYDQDLYTTSSVIFHEITLQNADEGNTGNTIIFGDGNHEIVARDGGNNFNFWEYGGTLADDKGFKFYTGGNKYEQNERLHIANDGVQIMKAYRLPVTDGLPGQVMTTDGNHVVNWTTVSVNLSALSQSIIPSADITYDLGSIEKQWRSLYVSTSTIYFGGVPMTVDTTTNTLSIGGSPLQANTGDITFNASILEGTGTNVEIIASTSTWIFDSTGGTTFPNLSTFDGQTLTDSATGVNYTLKIANGGGAGSVFGIGTGDATYGIANDALNHTQDGYVPYTVTAGQINFTVPGAGSWNLASDGTTTLPGKLWARASDSGSIAFTNNGTDEHGYLKVDAGYNMIIGAESNYYVKRAGQDRIAVTDNDTDLMASRNVKIHSNKVGSEYVWNFHDDGGLTFPSGNKFFGDEIMTADYSGDTIINGNSHITGNLQVDGIFTFTGTATILSVSSATFFGDTNGFGAFYAGVVGYTPLPVTVAQFTADYNDYVQLNFQNLSNGVTASTEWVATADNGNDTSNYIDMGIASSQWNGQQTNSVGTAADINDSWLYVQGDTTSSVGGNLIVGTIKDGKSIKFLAGSNGADSVVAQFSSSGLALSTGSAITFADGSVQASAISSSGTVVLQTLNVTNLSATTITLNGQPITGAIGYTGSAGTNGFIGSAGAVGYIGSRGFIGSAGTNGTNGYTGSAGTNGTNGFIGSAGTNGFIGSVGATGSFNGSTSTQVQFTNATASTSTTTGALVVTGGVGVGGTVTAGKFAGDGSSLTNVTVSQAGNIVGVQPNVTLVAGSYSYLFDNTGTFTMPVDGDIVMTGTNSILSVSGTTLLGGAAQVVGYYSTLGIKYPGGSTQYGMTLRPVADNTNAITFLNAAGTNIGSITQTTSTVKFTGDGSGLTNLTGVTNKTSGSWTVSTGSNTYSITVPQSGTYQIWVRGNIPNGIIAYNATAVVTNSNVPVVGAQYAWVYSGGGTPIDFTSIPNQFTGTNSTIVRSSTAPSATTNRFDFGINNTSGSTQTVYWGYVTL